MSYVLTELKELNTSQYDTCKSAALERIKTRIGDRPTRAQFTRELGSLWTVLDVLAMVVFIAAFVISSLHIMDYVSAAVSEAQGQYVTVNQIGYIFLAESSMILFMVQHGLTASRRKSREWWLRPFSVPLLLAGTAGVFIFVANLSSGIGALLSVMPPLFTTGIAFNLERLIIQTIRRREDITKRYLDALTIYEEASQDASKHPDYLPMLRQELWQKLTSLKANQRYVDAPAPFKVMATEREMQRDLWAYGEGETVIKSANFADIAPVQNNGREAHEDHFLAPTLTTNGKH